MKSTVEIPAAKNAIHRIHYPCKRNAIRVNSQNIIFKKAILPLLYRQILRKYKHCFHKSVHIVHRCTAIRLQKWLSANFVEKCFRPRPVQMVCGSGTARRISLIQPNCPINACLRNGALWGPFFVNVQQTFRKSSDTVSPNL